MQVSLDLLFNLGSLAHSVTQIVELCTSDHTGTNDVDLNDVGRMDGEGLLNTNRVRNASYSEGLGDSAAVLSDDNALEKLDSLTCSLFNAVVNTNGITNINNGKFRLKMLLGNSCNEIHYLIPPYRSDVRAFIPSMQRTAPRVFSTHLNIIP